MGPSALERFIDAFLNPTISARYLPAILKGAVVTIEVAAAVIVTGLALGLALAVLRSFRIRPVNFLIICVVDILRALPPLVLILIVYFGLPNVGLTLPSFAVLWVVLSAVLAAFSEEIFWAGILSVRKGQWEAARSTGLSYGQTLAYVILPQAVRIAVPPLTNRTIAITKNTALGSVIGVGEILNQASTAQSFSGNATPLTLGAAAYVLLFVPCRLRGPLDRAPLRLEARLMDALLEQFFDFGIMVQAAPLILRGFGTTLLLCAIVIPLGLAGGLGTALLGLAPSRWVRWPVIAAVDFFRPSRRWCSDLRLCGPALRRAAADPAPGGRDRVLPEHVELLRRDLPRRAGKRRWRPMGGGALDGLTAHQTLTSVILPQAVRNVLPDLLSNTVEAVKLTSIASVVALPELLYSADMARSLTYNASPLVMAGALYLALLWPMVRLISRFEHRLA
jgi:polar amino acid transport system permease protein